VCVALHAGEVSTASRRITSVVRADSRTGKLVRSVIVTPKTVMENRVPETVIAPRVVSSVIPGAANIAPTPASIDEAVDAAALRHDLPPQLIHSVIKVESNYNPNAVSSKGALGLMQLIPSTARRFGVSDVFDPAENIEGGAKYLKYLLDLYNNNYVLALAAYNAGEGAVARYGNVPPYAETQNYIHLVAGQLKKAKAAPAKSEKKELQPAEPEPSGPRGIQRIVDADGSVHYVTR
jgi:soluble lytic murein transglycosylase-like protein